MILFCRNRVNKKKAFARVRFAKAFNLVNVIIGV